METQLSITAQLRNGPYSKNMAITGLPANNSLYTPRNDQGNIVHLKDKDLILSHMLAKILHVKKGDYITIKPTLGNREAKKFRVTQLVTSHLGLASYMNQQTLSRLVGNSWLTNSLLFTLQPNSQKIFMKHINQFSNIINTQEKKHIFDILKEMLNSSMSSFIIIMCLFSGAIAVACILNNSIVSLSERERDVATFSVLGMTRMEIFRLFLYEGLSLNIIGLILGLWGGVYLAKGMVIALSSEMFHFPFAMQPIRLVESSFLIFGFIVLSYYVIYRTIAKTNWLLVLNTRE